ncbi:uncharacterized protein MONBRDRAFT_23696 [Monosiga brevicollis MX1]|uniref:Large ribosomal subunit protein uL3m n=1 Tax=Monosiga brevicollis TaxID=81824 RepID=A9UU71_MONBE|nr:uncharacterized protein MONBRDRAFT_23696 [Monosiga brevicollis MX1]EDQ91371.1 predicted protein [Monosiga brevicollis MX1]|eukprot:XP_001743793.1 hypothetical protein [Monosiga brevicollis MX1]
MAVTGAASGLRLWARGGLGALSSLRQHLVQRAAQLATPHRCASTQAQAEEVPVDVMVPLSSHLVRRAPLIAKKLGMTQTWDRWGTLIPMTVLQVEDCQVVGHRTIERDGYEALILGAETIKDSKLDGRIRGQFAKHGLPSKRHMEEARISAEAMLPIGYELSCEHFEPGQLVDVRGTTIGKGFAGVMKRHNFKGMPATHGVTKTHRRMGGFGGGQDPGRVWKGKRNAGRMGGVLRWQRNLAVIRIDTRYNLIMVAGSIPGAENSRVLVRDAIMNPLHKPNFISRPKGTLGAGLFEAPVPEEDPYNTMLD